MAPLVPIFILSIFIFRRGARWKYPACEMFISDNIFGRGVSWKCPTCEILNFEIIDWVEPQNTNRIPTEYQQSTKRVPAAAAPRPAQSAAPQPGQPRRVADRACQGAAAAGILLVLCWYSIGILLVFCWYSVSILFAFGLEFEDSPNVTPAAKLMISKLEIRQRRLLEIPRLRNY